MTLSWFKESTGPSPCAPFSRWVWYLPSAVLVFLWSLAVFGCALQFLFAVPSQSICERCDMSVRCNLLPSNFGEGRKCCWLSRAINFCFIPLGYVQPSRVSCPQTFIPSHTWGQMPLPSTSKGWGKDHSTWIIHSGSPDSCKSFLCSCVFYLWACYSFWAMHTFGHRPSFAGSKLWFSLSWVGFMGTWPW